MGRYHRVKLLDEGRLGHRIQSRNDRINQAPGMPLQRQTLRIGQPLHEARPHQGWTAQCFGVRHDEIRHEAGLGGLERHRQSRPEVSVSKRFHIEPLQHVHQRIGRSIQALQHLFQLGSLITIDVVLLFARAQKG